MAFAQGARTRLSVAAETSFGVLPPSPVFKTIPYKSHSLSLTKTAIQGADILGDRKPWVERHGHRAVGGSIEVDLRRGDYDLLLESAFFNTFDPSTHELVIGTTPRFFAIEDAALDINHYRQFSGCIVNSASFNLAVGQAVQATFDIVGRDMVQATASLDATPDDPTGNEPFDSFNDGVIYEGGTAPANAICVVSALNFSIENDVTPAHVILCQGNTDKAAQMQFGLATVRGTMTVYYENAALINKFLNENETSIRFRISDTTLANDYIFDFPRVKYMAANVPVSDMKSRFVELQFVALKDPTTGVLLKLTRPAP